MYCVFRMPNSCFAFGCKSGYEGHRDNLHLFKPKPGLRAKWEQALNRKDRKLTAKDHVCHLHFKEDELLRYKEYGRGKVGPIRRERKTWGLAPDAIPSLNLGIISAFSYIVVTNGLTQVFFWLYLFIGTDKTKSGK